MRKTIIREGVGQIMQMEGGSLGHCEVAGGRLAAGSDEMSTPRILPTQVRYLYEFSRGSLS